ncbi:hypothetical protein B9Z19DRAFT_100360 [Tuber borchii]|uniref:Uncharacterized protein n=1 Tax=Tuber borchii TaxID=42251 RepID=A0A2T6ZRU6_TUBBO|nr:hypothetical protein B9Z19DRAFT_100360 [Tuber borchii]
MARRLGWREGGRVFSFSAHPFHYNSSSSLVFSSPSIFVPSTTHPSIRHPSKKPPPSLQNSKGPKKVVEGRSQERSQPPWHFPTPPSKPLEDKPMINPKSSVTQNRPVPSSAFGGGKGRSGSYTWI